MFTIKLISVILLIADVSSSGIPGHFGFAPLPPTFLPHSLFAVPPAHPPPVLPSPVLPPPVFPAPVFPAPILPGPVLNTGFIPPATVFVPPPSALPLHPHVYAAHPIPLPPSVPFGAAVIPLPPPPPPPVVKTLVPGTLTKTYHTVSVGYPIVKTLPLIKQNYFKHFVPSSHAHLHTHSSHFGGHLHGFGLHGHHLIA